MRNLKKFLALVLATLMVISAAATVSAYSDVADDNIYAAAIAALTEYGIVNGTNTELDTFSPDDDVVRYQMALMMARALEPDTEDWQEGMAIFEDVTEWYGAIAYAYMNGIVTGMDATHFEPKTGIKCRDALIMAVRALGYEVDVTLTPYWIGAYQTAAKIGLTKNLQVTDPAKTLTRAETAQVIYNMLKATPADGGATIEAKNFGAATDKNTTTVIVTATEKQQYDKAAKPARADYVGTQLIVNGVPTGEVKYYPAALLGIESDKIEDSFAHAYDFVNYDAETDTFEKVVPGLDPVVVAGKDITVSGDKITIDTVAYYPVDEITGSKIKNEMVVYTGDSVAATSATIVVNKDGYVIGKDGEVTTAQAVDVNGITLYLYEGKFITETEALAKWGITLPGSSISYNTYTAQDINKLAHNYQISLYDDNRDGTFDRATVASLYMSVYNVNSEGKAQFGITGLKNEKVTFTNTDLKKGDIFTYTYNPATKVVNVVEVLETKSGVLSQINITNVNKDDKTKDTYNSVVVTIDGENYVLATALRVEAGYVGAIVETTKGADFEKIADKAAMDYIDWQSLVIGSKINYVLYGNTIITGKSVKAGDPYKNAIVTELTTVDSDAILVDAYIDGILTKDIKVSTVKLLNANSKDYTTYNFAKLNMFALTVAVNTVNDAFADAEMFQVRENNDGSVSLTQTTYGAEYPKTVPNTGDGVLKFTAGIADNLSKVDYAVRTNSSTIFYFIGADGEIKPLFGSPADNKTIDLNKATVYTNKLGYGKDGDVSGVIIVVCDGNIADATNIWEVTTVTTPVMLLNDSALTYIKATGETLGLTGTDVYRKYSVDAINLATGEKIDTIYVKEEKDGIVLEAGKAYDIVTATSVASKAIDMSTIKKIENVTSDDFKAARYWTITGIDSDKIATVKLTKDAKYDLKTNKPADAISALSTVYYVLNGDSTKTLVGVVVTEKSFKVDVKNLEGKATIILTCEGKEVDSKLIDGDDTYTFAHLDSSKTYDIKVSADGLTVKPVWNNTTRTYTVDFEVAE